jgi:hypothetical protein
VRGFGYKIVAPPTIAPRLDGTREDHLSLADGLLG